MSGDIVGFESIAKFFAASDGKWKSLATPDSFGDDGDRRGERYWRAVEAYYCAVGAICGGGLRGDDVTKFVNSSSYDANKRQFGDVATLGDTIVDRATGGEGVEQGGSDSSFVGDARSGGTGSSGVTVVDEVFVADDVKLKGRHWARNKAKKEKKKKISQSWRLPKVDGSGGCVSDGSTASVCTVDTRTAVEIQAVQTLAARRVIENEIAIARGKVQLKSFGDKAKTDALQRLAAARMEQRINEAKAKSQASFKKCDESLKSLGSTGSAGEFAMRCEVQKARRSEDMLKYVQEQADLLAKYASPEVLAMCREIKPPAPIDIFEIFGECSSDLSPEEVTGYYEELQRMQEEEDERSAVYY